MPDHGHAHHGPPDTSRGFEQSDLEFGAIGKGVLFYFIFTAGIGVVVYLGFLLFHQAEIPSQSLSAPSAPYPVLQNNMTDRTDIWNLRAREDYLLHNSTYVDSSKKTARVPVDQVIDQVGNSNDTSALNIAPVAQPASPVPGAIIDKGLVPARTKPSPERPVKKVEMPAPLGGHLKVNSGERGAQ